MADARNRQVKVLVVGGQAGQAGGRHRHAVVAPLARQDLFLGGFANGVVVVPDDLDGRVIGFRARIGKEDLGHRCRGQLDQPVRQLGNRRVGAVVEGVVVGQRLQRIGAGLHQARVAKAQRTAPQRRHALDVLAALFVDHMDAIAPRDHQRAHVLMRCQVGVGVQVGANVLCVQRAAFGGVVCCVHVQISWGLGGAYSLTGLRGRQ